MRAADSFDSAVDFLDDRLRTVLLGVDSRVKESAYEIRLRAARSRGAQSNFIRALFDAAVDPEQNSAKPIIEKIHRAVK